MTDKNDAPAKTTPASELATARKRMTAGLRSHWILTLATVACTILAGAVRMLNPDVNFIMDSSAGVFWAVSILVLYAAASVTFLLAPLVAIVNAGTDVLADNQLISEANRRHENRVAEDQRFVYHFHASHPDLAGTALNMPTADASETGTERALRLFPHLAGSGTFGAPADEDPPQVH